VGRDLVKFLEIPCWGREGRGVRRGLFLRKSFENVSSEDYNDEKGRRMTSSGEDPNV